MSDRYFLWVCWHSFCISFLVALYSFQSSDRPLSLAWLYNRCFLLESHLISGVAHDLFELLDEIVLVGTRFKQSIHKAL